MGPLATQILGDLGAEVISIEAEGGDTNRVMGPGPHRELSGVSLNLLRNKRNLSLDLKDPAGREVFLRLAAESDVVLTNLRPGPLGRLRLAYDDVRGAPLTQPGTSTTPLTVSTGMAVRGKRRDTRRPGRATSSRRRIMYEQFSSKNQ